MRLCRNSSVLIFAGNFIKFMLPTTIRKSVNRDTSTGHEYRNGRMNRYSEKIDSTSRIEFSYLDKKKKILASDCKNHCSESGSKSASLLDVRVRSIHSSSKRHHRSRYRPSRLLSHLSRYHHHRRRRWLESVDTRQARMLIREARSPEGACESAGSRRAV